MTALIVEAESVLSAGVDGWIRRWTLDNDASEDIVLVEGPPALFVFRVPNALVTWHDSGEACWLDLHGA